MKLKILFSALFLALAPAYAAERRPIVVGSAGTMQQIQSGDTLKTQPATTAAASINVPPGVAPTSPNNGDCWNISTAYYCRINGINYLLSTFTNGNPTAVAASSAGVPFKWEQSSYTAESEGGIWTGATYFNWAFNKEFTAANTPGTSSSPATPLIAIAQANGSTKDVVGIMADVIARTNSSNNL